MNYYWLITEPARGTSLRIDVTPKGSLQHLAIDAEAALQEWAAAHDADTLAEWKGEETDDTFSAYYADASGDDVQFIEER